jgi:hypothetical protein
MENEAMENESVLAHVRDAAQRLFADISDSGGRAAQDAMARGEWPTAAWARVEEAGFDRMLSDDLDGEGWSCAAAILQAMGYHALGLPLLETLVARGLLKRAGCNPDLPGPLALAHVREGGHARLRAKGDGLVLESTDLAVPWGRHATHLVATGTCDGSEVIAVFPLSDARATMQAGGNTAWEPRDHLRTDAVASSEWCKVPHGQGLDARAWGALAASCAMVGAAQRVLDLSLLYANDRVQFGKNIGKFQALQHALAMLSCEVAAATMAVGVACEAAERGDGLDEIAVAKVRTGQAAGVAAAVGHQVHGAIGFTDEHMLHHFTRRLWSWRREWGTERDWALLLGNRALAGGGAGIWPLLVQLSSGAAA